MNITKTIITATVALTMVAMIAPVMTSAATVPSACAGITLTRNLRVGSVGSDVRCLQASMNALGYTVAVSGAGSMGMETTHFGPKTLVAVNHWQQAVLHTSATQVGPMSRANLNAWLTGSPSPTPSPTPNPNPTGPVSVMLSPATPAAGNIVGGQATADLLHVTFTGSGTVTSVVLTRSGISDSNTLTNVYLFDGNTRITDGYSFSATTSMLTINGLNIAVNGSHEISARADVLSTAPTTASTIAVSLTGYTANGTTNTASVMGNTMSVVVGNLASATITAAASAAVPTANVNAGTTGYTFWSAPIQINTRAVWLKMANFRMIGSAPSDALSNIKLFIDGVDTGKVGMVMAINGSNYVVFDLTSAPISLMTGSHAVDMRADIQKGTNRTIQVSIQNASDLTIYDPQVGVNVAVSSTTAGSFSANNAGTISILTGSVTIVTDPTFTAQTTVSGGAANVVVARFKVHAYGEDVKISTLKIIPSILGATSTGSTCTTNATTGVIGTAVGTCGLNNVTLYFNGSQVGSQVNYVGATYTMGTVTTGSVITYTLGSQVIAPAGQDSWLEVRTDLQTEANVAYTGGTVKVGLPADTVNYGQGMSSQASITVPTAAIATSGLTISTNGLAVSKNSAYLNQSIAPNMSGVKIGSYVLQNQSTSQSIRLTSLSIATTITTTTVSNFSNLCVAVNSSSCNTSPIQFSGTQSGTTSTDVFSVTNSLAQGASILVDLYAQTGAATSGTIATTLNVSSIGAMDNIAAASGAKTGQTMTLGTGAVPTPTLVVSAASTTPAQFVAGAMPTGMTNASSQATFNFQSTSGASTITELKFTVSGSDASTSNMVSNICVGSICAQPVSGTAYLTGLNLNVPQGSGGLTQPVAIWYSPVGTNAIVPNNLAAVSLAYYKYISGGTTTTKTGTTLSGSDFTSVAAPTQTLVGSRPVVAVTNASVSGLNIGTVQNKIGEITVMADSRGDLKLNDIKFTAVSTGFATTVPTFTSAFISDNSSATAVTGSSCGQGSAAATSQTIFCEFATSGDTMTTTTGVTNSEDNNDFDGYIVQAGKSVTFSLYAIVAGATTSTSPASISTSLVAAGFNWDDASYAVFSSNAVTANPNNGTNLTGSNIYGFPTNSYTIKQ